MDSFPLSKYPNTKLCRGCGGKYQIILFIVQGGSNMTGTDLRVNKPHCAAAVRP